MRTIIQDLRQKIKATNIIDTILSGQNAYSDLSEYAIHKEISDLQPDTALLAIALNAKAIVEHLGNLPSPSLKILGFECERIFEEYGPLWLENAETKDVDPDRALELLMSIPDDLNSLVGLLSLNRDLIAEANNIESSLFYILKIQAASNALVAEEYIEVLTGSAVQDDAPLQIEMAHIPNDNIIQFPVQARA